MKKFVMITALITAMAAVFVFGQNAHKVDAKVRRVSRRVTHVRRIVKTRKSTKKVSVRTVQPKVLSAQTTATSSYAAPTNSNVVHAYLAADCSQGSLQSQFLCLINQYRVSNGLNPLTENTTLDKVAADYSGYMALTGRFSHYMPNGETYEGRCAAAGISCHGENLAYGFTSAQNLFDLWKASPDHNANMLGQYSQIGIGFDGYYATTEFKW